MIHFIVQNIGTIAVGLILAAVLAVIAAGLAKTRHKGGCAGCNGCANSNCPAANEYKGEG